MNYHVDNIKNIELFFKSLRNDICNSFENIENSNPNNKNKPHKTFNFKRKKWKRKADKGFASGGGGVISIMKGKVFEKVGVNISSVQGRFSTEMRKKIPGTNKTGKFYATGISLVAHMHSPFIPAAHMNLRFIHTTKSWFGGGIDLTPAIGNAKIIKKHFHSDLKQMCDYHNPSYYKRFKEWCDNYFYLPHREEARGMGGIFFDNIDKDLDKNFLFIQDVGKVFLQIFPEIIKKNMHKRWTNEQKEKQLIKRGRYVEFNLLYDRGTAFGLQTGGNIEAIFMSLPPNVSWL